MPGESDIFVDDDTYASLQEDPDVDIPAAEDFESESESTEDET
jgi:hypothetical protein